MTEKTTKTFAQQFAELEKITQEFEQGTMDLDESVKKFERGLELAHTLKTRLQAVEAKVKKIQQRFTEGEEA